MVTGSAGFVGFHTCQTFLWYKWKVIGLDAITDYYDVNLKKDRHKILEENHDFKSYEGFLQDQKLLEEIFSKHKPNIIIHLAAQAGVRYSIENPISYVESNLIGTFHILEMARKYKPEHLLIASTSSVYGSNKEMPLHENQKSDTQMSFYAATKKSNEAMAHSYSHLYDIPITTFRFFTVYGPWGRPDMALFKFTRNILSGKPIDVYNNGNMVRDFTYVSDIVEALYLLAQNKKIKSEIFNIGSGKTISINKLVSLLNGKKTFIPKRPGEPDITFADISKIKNKIGWKPKIDIKQGVKIMLSNLNDYKDQPLWNKSSIKKATSEWFKFLRNK